MKGDGTTQEQNLYLASGTRSTVKVNDILGEGDDPGHDFAIKVESANEVGIVCERPVYFNYQGVWPGGHDVVGFSP